MVWGERIVLVSCLRHKVECCLDVQHLLSWQLLLVAEGRNESLELGPLPHQLTTAYPGEIQSKVSFGAKQERGSCLKYIPTKTNIGHRALTYTDVPAVPR